MIVEAWGVADDVGRVRAHNEDSHLARGAVFVVADGMGGHAAGEVASRIAVDVFDAIAARPVLNVHDSAEAIAEANASILGNAADHPGRWGMGTTVAGLVVVTLAGVEHWQVFNVGDSRVYRLGADSFSQLTVDHSEAEELIQQGRITREEARIYERRNVVTRSLGTDPAPVLDSRVFPPSEDERFLVCTDGLTSEMDDGEIEQVLRTVPGAQDAADRLVALALEAGGRDNVTVVVVDGSARSARVEVDEDTLPGGIGRA